MGADTYACYMFCIPNTYRPIVGTVSINQVCSSSGGLIPERARVTTSGYIDVVWRATNTRRLCKPIIAINWAY